MATKTVQNSDGTDTTYDPASYTPTTPINSASMASTGSFQLPTGGVQTPQPRDYAASIAAIPSISDLYAGTEGASSQTQNTQNTLSDRILALTSDLGGKTQAQATAEANAGLPALNKSLTDTNNQIQALQKEALAIPLQLQQDATGRGITAGGLQPIQSGLLRDNAIKSLGLSSIAQTLQGNIALAQQQANRAVDLEFAPKQAELDYLNKAYQLNADQLNREDSKKAALFQAELQDRQQKLNQAKEDRQTILAMAASTVKNFPNDPQAQFAAQQAIQSGDVQSAFQLLGKYQTDPQATQKAILEQQLTRAQIAQANANAAKARAESLPSNKPPTQAQLTVAGYATRAQQAAHVIDTLTGTIAAQPALSFGIQQSLPSFAQTADTQAYNQAKRNFVNAVLRQESGAVISKEEFDNADKQYFPQPGDSQQVIAQKTQNRNLEIQNLIKSSGNAYDPAMVGTFSVDNSDQYASYRSQLQPGEILVQRGSNIVAVTPAELKPTDTKL